MMSSLQVNFMLAGMGSMEVALRSGLDQQDCSFVASYIPYDSVFELVVGLIAIVRGEGSAVARWNTEPIEYDMELSAVGDQAGIVVAQYIAHSRQQSARQQLFEFRGSRRAVIQPFWRALRRLESDPAYEQVWSRPFPSRDLRQLAQYLELLP
jgi:hypothetical protein